MEPSDDSPILDGSGSYIPSFRSRHNAHPHAHDLFSLGTHTETSSLTLNVRSMEESGGPERQLAALPGGFIFVGRLCNIEELLCRIKGCKLHPCPPPISLEFRNASVWKCRNA